MSTARRMICPSCRATEAVAAHVHLVEAGWVVWPRGAARLSPPQYRLLGALLAAHGRVVRREALVDAVWGDDPDGGPMSAMNGISVLVHGLRRRLAGTGFPGAVRTWPRSGYELVLR